MLPIEQIRVEVVTPKTWSNSENVVILH